MKPSIFNTEMVRAILDGRKTQTRRVKGVPLSHHTLYQQRINADGYLVATFDGSITIKSEYKVGDIIYVRETFAACGAHEDDKTAVFYKATDESNDRIIKMMCGGRWTPSIHMPKEYARLFLRVKDIRIERLNEISEEDAKAEGIASEDDFFGCPCYKCYMKDEEDVVFPDDPVGSFASLWESIYGNGSFDNRYVWVTEFEKISKEEAMSETAT